MTLNLLRTSRINPRLSAWSQVQGFYDFNRTPLAPPGTRVLVHEKPSLEFPTLFLRSQHLCELAEHLRPSIILEDGGFSDWQRELAGRLDEPADPRTIEFFVDPVGGRGKSWFIRKYLSTNPRAQCLSIGKRDDLAHAIDDTCNVFLFSIPRTTAEYLQYPILEQLKDRLVFSPKYHSTVKVLERTQHVIVFMNGEPDMTKLTADRYIINTL
jgi:hypothetical protein